MKKKSIIIYCLLGIVFISLIIFASTRSFNDSHLRKEGKRIRMTTDTLIVEDPVEETKNFVYNEKNIEVGDKEAKLIFELLNVNDKGYPTTVTATINGHEFYRENNLDIENKPEEAYKIFLHFHEIGKEYIAFTFTSGLSSMATTLYVIDLDGNIILKEKEIDKNGMIIKDYGDFITYKDNTSFTIYASRLDENLNYQNEYICKANSKDIVEAYYTYTYKNSKITKKQTKTITASNYIKDNSINCNN